MKSMKTLLSHVGPIMGATGTKLTVSLEQSQVRAGESIRGHVVLQLDKPRGFDEIEVTLRGKEKTVRRASIYNKRREFLFLSVSNPVINLRKQKFTPGGTYSYPFTIHLPPSIPSTTSYRVGVGEAGFKIQYKVCIRIGSFETSKEIRVYAAPLLSCPAPCMVQPTTQTITSAGRLHQGCLTLAASVRDTSIRKGEQVVVTLACRNDSLIDVKRVQVQIIEFLNYNNKNSRAGKVKLAGVEDVTLPGLRRQAQKERSEMIHLSYPSVEVLASRNEQIYTDLVSNDNSLQITCPHFARDSYFGTLVDVRHYVKIKFITNTLSYNPSIKIPLKVGLPETLSTPADMISQASTSVVPVVQSTNVSLHDDHLPMVCAVEIPSDASAGSLHLHESPERSRAPDHMSAGKNDVVILDRVMDGAKGGLEMELQHLTPVMPPTTAT